MREILFKAKRIDNGEWVEGFLYIRKDGVSEINYYNKELDVERYTHEVDSNTICQYTGLTDKSGNKIWENDVVLFDNDFWLVKWDDMDAQFTIEYDCTIENFGNVWGMDCEVYGNIFDNPKLLEGGVE